MTWIGHVGDGQVFECQGHRCVRPAIAFAYMRLGWHGKCAEVGVQFGNNAKVILDVMRPSRFVAVDPWERRDVMHGVGADQYIGESYFPETYESAKRLLQGYGVEFVRERSTVALPKFADDTFDFVYIDGDHSEEVCSQDIRNALRATRLYGVVGGHDYGLPPQVAERDPVYTSVAAAVHSVLDGHFVDAMASDWWVVVTPELKELS